MSEQATDGGYSEYYVRSLEVERDKLAAEVEKWKERCAWKEKVSFEEWEHLRAENTELLAAAEQVIVAHDSILPVMNAYMGTLGKTYSWNVTCAASDALRSAITKAKGNKNG